MNPAFPSRPRTVQLDPVARRALCADQRRIVIVGASGWIGKSLLAGILSALGEGAMRERVVCFGSTARDIALNRDVSVPQLPLDRLSCIKPAPTILFHLAFLTKDKVAGMDEADYVEANSWLSDTVLGALDKIGVDRVFVASSGAAARAEDAGAARDLRVYGRMKCADEAAFARWAREGEGRRAMIVRIFSLAGPFINKFETYALASFILDALAERPIRVTAPRPVVRSYVAVRELLSLALIQQLSDHRQAAVTQLDSGGDALELGEVAALVGALFSVPVERAEIRDPAANNYAGAREQYDGLLQHYGIAPVTLADAIVETAAFIASLDIHGSGGAGKSVLSGVRTRPETAVIGVK